MKGKVVNQLATQNRSTSEPKRGRNRLCPDTSSLVYYKLSNMLLFRFCSDPLTKPSSKKTLTLANLKKKLFKNTIQTFFIPGRQPPISVDFVNLDVKFLKSRSKNIQSFLNIQSNDFCARAYKYNCVFIACAF